LDLGSEFFEEVLILKGKIRMTFIRKYEKTILTQSSSKRKMVPCHNDILKLDTIKHVEMVLKMFAPVGSLR